MGDLEKTHPCGPQVSGRREQYRQRQGHVPRVRTAAHSLQWFEKPINPQ